MISNIKTTSQSIDYYVKNNKEVPYCVDLKGFIREKHIQKMMSDEFSFGYKTLEEYPPIPTDSFIYRAKQAFFRNIENPLSQKEREKNQIYINDNLYDKLDKYNIPLEDAPIMTFLGQKPATLMPFPQDFCTAKLPPFMSVFISKNHSMYLFHNKTTLKVIEKNKDFLTKRLELDKNTSSQDIFKLLLSDNSPLNGISNSTTHDIVGIMLGFPPKNSIIFQLRMELGCQELDSLDLNTKKVILKQHLLSKNTIYKNFDKKFKDEISKSIDEIQEFKPINIAHAYQFIKFTDEPMEFQRINDSIRKFWTITTQIAN